MSENTTATTETIEDAELSPDALDAAVKATAAAEFENSFRPPTSPAADTEPGDEPAQASGQADDEQPDDDGDNTNREAAKWRTKLRESESQKAALATRLENMQRAAIDTQVAALGIKPAALWASGAELGDLLDDTGVPDIAKVQAAAASAKETLGIPDPSRPPRGLHSGSSVPQRPRNGFVDAFRPRSRNE